MQPKGPIVYSLKSSNYCNVQMKSVLLHNVPTPKITLLYIEITLNTHIISLGIPISDDTMHHLLLLLQTCSFGYSLTVMNGVLYWH